MCGVSGVNKYKMAATPTGSTYIPVCILDLNDTFNSKTTFSGSGISLVPLRTVSDEDWIEKYKMAGGEPEVQMLSVMGDVSWSIIEKKCRTSSFIIVQCMLDTAWNQSQNLLDRPIQLGMS